jgi:hypothetical protein
MRDERKEAAQARNLAGFSTISRAIKQGSLSSGHYWNIFHKCSEDMKVAYLEAHGGKLPPKHVHKFGRAIQQIDPMTNSVIQTFQTMHDVVVKFQMSRTSVKRASELDIVHHGFKWRILSA